MTAFFVSNLKQYAVYWSPVSDDGLGGYVFSTPVEIPCRWEQRTNIFLDENLEERISKITVFVNYSIELHGYLYLGRLSTVPTGFIPSKSKTAYRIMSLMDIPSVHNKYSLNKALL